VLHFCVALVLELCDNVFNNKTRGFKMFTIKNAKTNKFLTSKTKTLKTEIGKVTIKKFSDNREDAKVYKSEALAKKAILTIGEYVSDELVIVKA
jgi:hypothetical protein